MITIGIDQSYTSTGIIAIEDNKILKAKIITSPSGDLIFRRAWDISEEIKSFVKEFENPIVSIEGLAFAMTGNATRDLAGLQFCIVSKLMFQCNINPIIVAPPTLKKFATGNGKASKDDMINMLPKVAFDYFKNNMKLNKSKGLTDITDAFYLAMYGLKESIK